MDMLWMDLLGFGVVEISLDLDVNTRAAFFKGLRSTVLGGGRNDLTCFFAAALGVEILGVRVEAWQVWARLDLDVRTRTDLAS